MRMPRVRFTVRRMMIAVAVIAIAAGAGVTCRRWAYYRGQAGRHASLEEGSRDSARICRENVAGLIGRAIRRLASGEVDWARACLVNAASMAGESGRLARMTAHHARLRAKYEHAAGFPFLPEEPDPPEPE